MSYDLRIKPEVRKYLLKIGRDIRLRIARAIDTLKDNPRPDGCKKLKGRDEYRIRVGDYRILYEIHGDILVVLVVRVAHRSEAYKL
jgi:mRNA interferase RelE/StbE